MTDNIIHLPEEIEQRSFEIITQELGNIVLDPQKAPIIKRVIHTTADFDYARTLYFSEDAIERGKQALLSGCTVITDTTMAQAGIKKGLLKQLGAQVHCYIADEDVGEIARQNQSTRAVAAVDKAAELKGPLIFAIGNAPTALIRISQLIKEGKLSPALVIGAPVGFVNILESKDAIMDCQVPMIISTGRKGGSNVAAAILNALLLSCTR